MNGARKPIVEILTVFILSNFLHQTSTITFTTQQPSLKKEVIYAVHIICAARNLGPYITVFDQSSLLDELARLHRSKARQTCGEVTQGLGNKITNGDRADAGEWPWMVALRRNVPFENSYCGGTLVSDRHVVTAAHCVDVDLQEFPLSDVKLIMGEVEFNKSAAPSHVYRVESMSIHDDWNPTIFKNDIAILKTDRPVRMSRSVHPICLPTEVKLYVHEVATVVECDKYYSEIEDDRSKTEINARFKIVDSMMCAGGEDGKDACQGDSGGPLNCFNNDTLKWELCGIVSTGVGCGKKDFPGIYTRVTEYYDWIVQTMGLSPESTPGTTTTITTEPTTGGTGCYTYTYNGQRSHAPCVLPFILSSDGKLYSECTKEGQIAPWCPTSVTAPGVFVAGSATWGYCLPGCPGTGTIENIATTDKTTACFETHIDYSGNDLEKVPASSAQECQRHCQQTHQCLFFTYSILGCFPKTSDSGRSLTLVEGAISGPVVCKESKTCTPGWTPLGHKCIYASKEELGFAEAGARCGELGGRLAEPADAKEAGLLAAIKGDMWHWIGIMVKSHEEKRVAYVSSGQQVVSTNFAPGEPDNRDDTGEFCVAAQPGGEWHDRMCETPLHFLCEM